MMCKNIVSLGQSTCHGRLLLSWTKISKHCSILYSIRFIQQVLSAFHLGRQGNSLSYMGKGVLRNATLCLRHVVEEITAVVDDNNSWLTPWIEGSEGETRLEWLRSLWNYRDQEVMLW